MKRLHLVIFSASAAILAAEFAVSSYLWTKLPALVPTHFNFAMTPDAYAPKSIISVLLVPLIQLVIFLLFVLLYRYPQYTNWPTTLILVTVEEKKREQVYAVLRSMLSWTLLWLSLFMGYLQFAILSTANGRAIGPGTYVMVSMLAVMLLLIIVINIRMVITVYRVIKG